MAFRAVGAYGNNCCLGAEVARDGIVDPEEATAQKWAAEVECRGGRGFGEVAQSKGLETGFPGVLAGPGETQTGRSN